jgi:polysaccharide biosynthesis protein PslG
MTCRAQTQRGLPDPSLPTPVGVNIHFKGEPKAELDLIRDAGFRLARMDLFWAEVERRAGVYDFSGYDALVAGLKRRAIRPLFILDYGNPLYDSESGRAVSPRTPEGRGAYARFCAAAAAHFRGLGVIWELWNEPNGFWVPRPNVVDYATMAVEAARAMRSVDPGCTLIAPGVSGFDPAFVEACFRHGLLQYLDAVSVHPYRDSPPETALPEFARLRRLIDRYAAPGQHVAMACSEWGYSSVGISEEEQGQLLARQWLTNLMAGSRFSIWYDWKEDGSDPKEKEHHFGAVRPDLQPKPAYRAARALTRGLSGLKFIRRLDLGRPEDYVLLFGRADQQALAIWTTGSPDDLFLPPGTVIDRATDWLGEAVQIPARAAGPWVRLGPSPLYIRVRGSSPELALRSAWQAELESTSVDGATPGAVRINVSLRNPTARRLPVALRIAAPPLLEGAWADPLPAALEPKETLQLQWVGTWPLRARQVVEVPVHVRVGPIGSRQTLSFEVRNALSSEFRWRSDAVDLLVHNQGSEPFAGEVRLWSGDQGAGTAPSGALLAQKPIRQAAGSLTTTMRLALPQGTPLSGGIYDVRGEFLAPIELRRRQSIPIRPASGTWQIAVDGNPAVQPREVKLSVEPSPGTDPPFPHAVRCDFDLGQGWKFCRVVLNPPPPLDEGARRLGMWVYSDGSSGSIRCRFTDSRGQTFQPAASAPLSGNEWQWVSMRLDGREAGYWGGPADGVVHGPIRWDSLVVYDPLTEAPRRGSLYVTGLTVEY